jgi:hypothetical protein
MALLGSVIEKMSAILAEVTPATHGALPAMRSEGQVGARESRGRILRPLRPCVSSLWNQGVGADASENRCVSGKAACVSAVEQGWGRWFGLHLAGRSCHDTARDGRRASRVGSLLQPRLCGPNCMRHCTRRPPGGSATLIRLCPHSTRTQDAPAARRLTPMWPVALTGAPSYEAGRGRGAGGGAIGTVSKTVVRA